MTKQHFVGLDGLRAVAALVVLAHHVEIYARWGTHLFAHGYLAVDLFFMLSGFVIGYAYERRLIEGLSLARYAELRLVRLYPIIALGAVAGFAMSDWAHVNGADQWLLFGAQVLLIPAIWRSDVLFPFNPAQWSLLFELAANFVHALLARWLSDRRLLIFTAGTVAMLIFCAWHYRHLGVGWARWDMPGGLVRALAGFFVGLLLYRAWERAWIPRVRLPWPILALALPLSVVAVGTAGIAHRWYADLLPILLLFPLLVWATASFEPKGMTHRVCAFLGALSYPLYAMQAAVERGVALLAPRVDLSPLVASVLMVSASLLLAWLVLRYYDEPSRRWLRSAIDRICGRRGAPARI